MIDLRAILISPDTAVSDIMSNVGTAISPFTGGIQTTELPGAKWKLTFGYQNLNATQARVLKAVKAMLRGGANVAHIYDLSYIARRSIEPGTPIISGIGQSGISLATSGWTPNTQILKMGDQLSYLSTDNLYRMHMVTADVNSTSTGLALVPILPPMRNPPVNATPISTVAPVVSAMLTDGGAVSINGMLSAASFTFTEVLYGIL